MKVTGVGLGVGEGVRVRLPRENWVSKAYYWASEIDGAFCERAYTHSHRHTLIPYQSNQLFIIRYTQYYTQYSIISGINQLRIYISFLCFC